MNNYYCYVLVDGERRYFSDCDLAKANQCAQQQADKTGSPVKRQDCGWHGYSVFYPKGETR